MGSNRYDLDVEEVLKCATALEYFKEWIRLDPTRQEEATDLYFALKGFKNYLKSHDAAIRAQMIHRKYISLKSGMCDFLPKDVRQEMSDRIHALKSSSPISGALFEPVWHPLCDILKSWHARFVCSQVYDRLRQAKEDIDFSSREDYEEVQLIAPPETLKRQPRKTRHVGEASTSRTFEERSLDLSSKRDSIPSTYQHEKAEERSRFVKELTVELNKILEEINRHGGAISARDLPRSQASRLTEFSFKEKTNEKTHEKTMSDEELEKYADKLDRRRSDSESPPETKNSFNPKPFSLVSSVPGYDFNVTIPERFTYTKNARSGFNDTGFCSSESNYFSSERSYRSLPFSEHAVFNHTPFTTTLQRRPTRSSQVNCFATLPRKMTQLSRPIQLTEKIKCRFWKAGDIAPYVGELDGPLVTLYQFRKLFAIRKDENLRLLFKSPCDDNSAPFQWSLISDDSTLLPLYEGKIVGEARRYVDSD